MNTAIIVLLCLVAINSYVNCGPLALAGMMGGGAPPPPKAPNSIQVLSIDPRAYGLSRVPGPMGPIGPQGPMGPQGPPGQPCSILPQMIASPMQPIPYTAGVNPFTAPPVRIYPGGNYSAVDGSPIALNGGQAPLNVGPMSFSSSSSSIMPQPGYENPKLVSIMSPYSAPYGFANNPVPALPMVY